MGKVHIGISGWTFPGWKKVFYPEDLPQRRELEYASRQLNSIEINGTFYSLQRPESFQNWYDQTPKGFQFSVKGGQYITHVLRLKDAEDAVANFFASGLLCLKEKLGPILWQFPPYVMLKDDRFERFLELLPRTSQEAEKLAERYTSKMKGRAWTKAGGKYPVRHAFEFRHKSFQDPGFYKLLSKYGAALVIAHSAEKWPYVEELTGDFVYARLQGFEKRYSKGYPPAALKEWAKKIQAWKKKRDVYVYLNEEHKVRSPQDALTLNKYLKSK